MSKPRRLIFDKIARQVGTKKIDFYLMHRERVHLGKILFPHAVNHFIIEFKQALKYYVKYHVLHEFINTP